MRAALGRFALLHVEGIAHGQLLFWPGLHKELALNALSNIQDEKGRVNPMPQFPHLIEKHLSVGSFIIIFYRRDSQFVSST